MPKIHRALISVSDKTGLLELATALRRHGVEILSTGGTAKSLADAGIPVVQVSDYTGQPEILEGRVKTLVPRIHGGILARRGSASHRREMKAHDILPIDLVVVNLYPFESAAFRDGATFENAIENIDIGGPTMVRAAAKNFADVTVVVDPADYPAIVAELDARRGAVLPATNFALARKAFAHTAYYDSVIAGWLATAQPDARRAEPGAAGVPADARPAPREGPGPALRREPAPERRPLPRARAARRRCRRDAAGRQGALVQQSPRSRGRLGRRARLFRPPLRGHRQAQQPLRRRGGQRPDAGLRTGAGRRSGLRVRRRDRHQPARDPRAGAEDHRDVLRGGHRPRLRAQGPRDPALEEGSAHSPGGARRRPGRPQAHHGGLSAPGPRLGADPRRAQAPDRHETQAERRGIPRPRFRLADGAPRQIERHRLHHRSPAGRCRRRPDEPRGLLPDRRLEGRAAAARERLSVPTLSSPSATASTRSRRRGRPR